LKAQLLLEESLSAYFPEMVFTDSGITVQLHRNTQLLKNDNQLAMLFTLANLFRADQMIRQWERSH
ncbi:hypothetical protein CF134_15545, partial [Aeromonas salmonicida]